MLQRFSNLTGRHKTAVLILAAGLAWFLGQVGEILRDHAADGFNYFSTPLGVADVVSLISSTITMVVGALGVPLDTLRDLIKRPSGGIPPPSPPKE